MAETRETLKQTVVGIAQDLGLGVKFSDIAERLEEAAATADELADAEEAETDSEDDT